VVVHPGIGGERIGAGQQLVSRDLLRTIREVICVGSLTLRVPLSTSSPVTSDDVGWLMIPTVCGPLKKFGTTERNVVTGLRKERRPYRCTLGRGFVSQAPACPWKGSDKPVIRSVCINLVMTPTGERSPMP
jgi:hypothetical protein